MTKGIKTILWAIAYLLFFPVIMVFDGQDGFEHQTAKDSGLALFTAVICQCGYVLAILLVIKLIGRVLAQ